MVLTSSRLLCHILVAVVVPEEHRGEDLGPENPEAADHHGEDENGLAVAEQAALEVGGVILIIGVVWLQHKSDHNILPNEGQKNNLCLPSLSDGRVCSVRCGDGTRYHLRCTSSYHSPPCPCPS